MVHRMQSEPRRYTRLEWLQFGLFWSWNLVFLAFMSLGFAPVILPQTFAAVRMRTIPAPFLAYALVLAAIPVVVVILGLTVLRRSPGKLFALGYVIEGPLMLMLAVRFFAIREATPGTQLLMVIALLGMAAFLWMLLDPLSGRRRPVLESLRLAGLALMAVTSLYAAAWIAFYALPLGVEGLRALANLLRDLPGVLRDLARSLGNTLRNEPIMLPFSVLGFILLLYTGTLFVLTPLAVPFLSVRAWWRSVLSLARRTRWTWPAALSVGVLAAVVGLSFLANRQPQAQAFALLENPPASTGEAQSMLERSQSIRKGLLNAYLAPFHYISAQGEVRHISDIYRSTFRIPLEQAYRVQRLYESLASPLLYQPVHRVNWDQPVDNRALVAEPQEAARLYQRFFDAPIADAERPAIVRAVRSTWDSGQAEAAWQAVDDREVHLKHQGLTIQSFGDFAEVELYEVYQNQTGERQEVIYYINLPESAVLTGLWLGDKPGKINAYSFQVAPRGAAQAVYREQTRVFQDPALLEQIGPRQYRLRVYPIQPMLAKYDNRTNRTEISEAPLLYLWLEWRQMAEGGTLRMPKIAYLRNVYWDAGTERLVNGKPFKVEEWLPAEVANPVPASTQSHRVDFPGGQTVLAIPAGQVSLPGLPAGLRLAVVLDRSLSMQEHASEAAAALERLKALGELAQPVDVYQTASPYRGEGPSILPLDELDPQAIVYFGGQNAGELIAQFNDLHSSQRGDRTYDAVIVLTDSSGYELGASLSEVSVPDSPVWVVHMGGGIPLGYDDGTLGAIQASGGGVAGSLEEALQRMEVALDAGRFSGTQANEGETTGATSLDRAALPVVDLVDGYLWMVLPTARAEEFLPPGDTVEVHNEEEPYAALAARRLILAEQQRGRGSISQVETLDALHALAQNYGIVTPYSSMIVLVNVQQQALLDQLSELDDRYQREFETLSETTPASPVPLVGVPEPHEWMLIGLAAALLAYLGIRRRAEIQAFKVFR